ncbi:flagellin [Maritimibacter sp. HL-12]|uniref:flagellin n=1 Tax=Maritimibacter sp. HL-12 TaxID=1162418 RepID=UPI000A0EF731|nr:flagellin [Maritimibacter sp. HL-12]SMH43187.1 flagellar hook-associated protein 3 FlgL [Maritimibacter sp. HL-12]
MSTLSVGDLANTFQLRRLSVSLKTDLTKLGQELATGRKTDLGATLSGDFGPVAAIERSISALNAYRTANTEAAHFLEVAQTSLDHVQTTGRDLTSGLLAASGARDRTMIEASAEDARQKFDSVVSKLNASAAGRTVFSGAATDGPALAGGEDMLAALSASVAGAATAGDVIAAVDAWFGVGGGFESFGYLGSQTALGPMAIADGETLGFQLRADSPEIRETLKGLAFAGLVAEGALPGDVAQQAELFSHAALHLINADSDLTNLRAGIGTAQGRVEAAQVRNASEASAHDLALGALVLADPYETATALQAVQSQIETLYTVTARIAGLRFTDYMR